MGAAHQLILSNGTDMDWQSWQAFWHMGGRGLYIWLSFGISAVALGVEIVGLRHRQRVVLQKIQQNRRAPQ